MHSLSTVPVGCSGGRRLPAFDATCVIVGFNIENAGAIALPDRYDACHAVTAAWEGGWGITEKRWHEYQDKMRWKRMPVRNVTRGQALVFYRPEFWQACGAPNLLPGVDLAVYDASVNCGVLRGRKWLLASVGSHKPAETVKRICQARLCYKQGSRNSGKHTAKAGAGASPKR